MVKSRLVLNAALKQPGIGDLSIVRAHEPEQIEWLEKYVIADFSVAPEMLRIALAGDNPDDLKKIVDALRESYKKLVLAREKVLRQDRLRNLGEKRVAYEEKLKAKKKDQLEREKQEGVSKDIAVRGLIQTFVHMQLTWTERDLLQTDTELRHQQTELAVKQIAQKNIATAPVSDVEIQDQLNKEPAVLNGLQQIASLKLFIDDFIKRSAQGEKDPKLQPYRKQMTDAQALDKVRKDLTPEIISHVRSLREKMTADAINQLQVRVASLSANKKDLEGQVDGLRKSIRKMGIDASEFDNERDSTIQLEEFTKRIWTRRRNSNSNSKCLNDSVWLRTPWSYGHPMTSG